MEVTEERREGWRGSLEVADVALLSSVMEIKEGARRGETMARWMRACSVP
jgi:hypothetical protein